MAIRGESREREEVKGEVEEGDMREGEDEVEDVEAEEGGEG